MWKEIKPKLIGLLLMFAAVGTTPSPAATYDGTLTIEDAWAVPFGSFEGGTQVYLVISNGQNADVVLTGVQGSNSELVALHTGSEKVLTSGLTIPVHSELYMLPGGVHAWLASTAVVGSTIPLRVLIDGQALFEVNVKVIASIEDVPDHHNYKH